jgi:hypothetical protein
MRPINFNGSNKTLAAPAGRDDITPLHVYSDGRQCVSCWELTDEEKAEVARTGVIFVNILSGPTQPPMYIGVGSLAKALF